MGHSRKVATCCYCGRRSELVLTGAVQHELSCGSCGAPLHNMKRLKSDPKPTAARALDKSYGKSKKKSKSKKKKSFGAIFLDEIFDAVEDIFD